MIYIEMSRDEIHGGGTWAFTNCIWAPTEKRGGGEWPFWTNVLKVRDGDIIIHLRGISPQAYFVGYSIASSDGFRTNRRPPIPGEWEYANSFFRADLSSFTPFHKPINLSDLFAERRPALELYFDTNKAKTNSKSHIFFVRQSGRLQCLNGAYLSEVDEDLLVALFSLNESVPESTSISNVISIETKTQLTSIHTRLGQAKFSAEIKRLYGHKCCFPGCDVSDIRFLIGAHIARWSDNIELRGHLGNGLCFCLMHDKAFELGLFTIDDQLNVYVNPRVRNSDSGVIKRLLEHHGESITQAEIKPLDDALLEHWIRVGIEP